MRTYRITFHRVHLGIAKPEDVDFGIVAAQSADEAVHHIGFQQFPCMPRTRALFQRNLHAYELFRDPPDFQSVH